MEIKHIISQNGQVQCLNCNKNINLIEKYQKLIKLLKKKASRPSQSPQQSINSLSNKFSLGDKTTSHSLINTPNIIKNNQYSLLLILNKIELKNKNIKLYQQIFQNKSFVVSIKQSLYKQNKKSFAQINKRLPIKFDENLNVLMSNKQFLSQSALSNIAKPKWAKQSKSLINEIKQLNYKYFSLQQQNSIYKQKIQKLSIQMQQALARQIKQNRKKTQSLQMVAQQMMEKNQIISQLQQKITMLQQRYHFESNGMLEDQLTTLKKQIQKLQKDKLKLQIQNKKHSQKIEDLQSKKLIMQKEINLLKQQNQIFKLKTFQLEQKANLLKRNEWELNKSQKQINKIMKRLQINYRQMIMQHKRILQINLNNKQNELQLNEQRIKQLQEQYKIQLILIYLYNITDDKYDFLQHENKFDNQQLEVITNHKQKFKEMIDKIKNLQEQINNKNKLFERRGTIDSIQPIQSKNYQIKQTKLSNFHGRLSQQCDNLNNLQKLDNVYCHNQLMEGSILDMFNVPHDKIKIQHQQLQYINQNDQQIKRISPEKNLTMKLLQLQIEKNKQIQKISQLKEKYMYIRNIIFNLLRSLQLKNNNMKNQTTGILLLLFDVFQYSEQEKQLIFSIAQCKNQKQKNSLESGEN